MVQDKSRERRLRRRAKGQGLRLVKSRQTDPLALHYGWRIETTRGRVVRARLTLDEIERYLDGEGR
jgi:hypothetical protein